MIDRVIESIKEKYWYLGILVIYVVILLGMVCDASMPNNNAEIYIGEQKLVLKDNLLEEKYISLDDITANFRSNVYYDKIARKLVITSKDNILKTKSEDEYTKLYDNKVWYDIQSIAKYFDYKIFKDTRNNIIYIYNVKEISAKVLKNRTMVYNNNQEIIGVLDKNSKVDILLNRTDEKYFNVKIKNEYIGKIEKKALQYDKINEQTGVEEQQKIIMTTVTNNLSSNTDLNVVNILAVDMLRINSEKTVVEEMYTLNNNLNQEIYAVLNNGYSQASFNSSILSNIIKSDMNKENIVDQIIEFVNKKKLKGLIIDFKNFKVSDKELIEQYIKEISALLHKNNKKVMVKINSIAQYNLDSIKDFVDYVVVQAYGNRTIASKTSASHSTISYVKKLVEDVKSKMDNSKIILEIAPYSILWTEKAGSVLNAEIYSMNAVSEYIKENKIQTIYDSISGQNMINYTKGTITYKMWIEDSTSILAKTNIAKELAGIAIYKSGYENKSIYSIID